MQVIPAIDLLGGKCVRLSQGAYETAKVYEDDPQKVANYFASLGFHRLHVVDLDGAKARQIVNYTALERILAVENLEVDFGGGIKSEAHLQKVFHLGVKFAVIGSLGVKNPELFRRWLSQYGSDRLVIMLDVKGETLVTMGWQQGTDINIFDFLGGFDHQIKHVFCTDISKDGMLEGPNFDLYDELIKQFPHLKFTASGGVSSIQDLEKLASSGLDGVIVGKAIYEGKINLDNLKTEY